MKPPSQPTLERLILYYQFIQSLPSTEDTLLSSQMAKCAGVDATSVRRDLAAIGVRGRTRLGYGREGVLRAIEGTLGMKRTYRAVIVGAGRLGCALASYPFYGPCGLSIVALLDVDPLKLGSRVGGIPVESIHLFSNQYGGEPISLALVAVPVEAAQSVADLLVKAGIRVIWNFSPTILSVPEGVFVRQEQLAGGLGVITHRLGRAQA